MNEGNEMMQKNSENIFLFYPKNQEFLNGSVKWTVQNMRELVELIISVLLFLFLLVFLIMYPLEFWVKLSLILVLGGEVLFLLSGVFSNFVRKDTLRIRVKLFQDT